MNFRELKKEFRKIAVREFTDMDDFTQEELNAFLFYYNKCRTEEAIMKVLDDWCISVPNCFILQCMSNKKYYIDYLYKFTNDLYNQIKSIPIEIMMCTELDKELTEFNIDDIYAKPKATIEALEIIRCRAVKLLRKIKKRYDNECNNTPYDSSSSDDEYDDGEEFEFDPNSESEED